MAKPLLILDIDETLIYATKSINNNKPDFVIYDYKVYKRPGLNEFLKTVYQHFKLAIWSLAGDDYVREIVKQIKPKDIDFEFVWGRSKAVYQRNSDLDELRTFGGDRSHYHYVKPLKKVKKLGYNIEKCLIIDDSPHKSKLNYGNTIYPSSYNGNDDDNELELLNKYLESIKDCPNFREIEKRKWRNQTKTHDL